MALIWVLSFSFVLPLGHAEMKSDQFAVSPCQYFMSIDGDATNKLILFLEHQISMGHWSSILNLEWVLQMVKTSQGEALPVGVGTTEFKLRERVLTTFLRQGVDREVVAAWTESRLEGMRGEVSAQRIVASGTQKNLAHRQMKWGRIKGGTFTIPGKMVGENISLPVTFTLPYDLEVLDTPVTQGQWLEVMGDVTEDDRRGMDLAEVVTIGIGGRDVSLVPEFPASNISTFSMLEFANRLSRRDHYPETYSFKGHMTGDANRGLAVPGSDGVATFNGQSFEEILGYRLPTRNEWLVMAWPIFQAIDSLPVDLQIQALNEWGWFNVEIGRRMQPVAMKKPVCHPSAELYDLVGLVSELVHHSDQPTPLDQKSQNPARGLSVYHVPVFQNDPKNARADTSYQFLSAAERHCAIGFRLVRTLRDRK